VPKKIKFESFKSRLLSEAFLYESKDKNSFIWKSFLDSLTFQYGRGEIKIGSELKNFNEITFNLSDPVFYKKKEEGASHLNKFNYVDSSKEYNKKYFENVLFKIADEAKIKINMKKDNTNLNIEREFHDEWAKSEHPEEIKVLERNEAMTSPEMRFITKELGSLEGKKLLDLGCGLGEASVYFAMKGADVTSCDLSPEMLDLTEKLAHINNTEVTKHLASADDLKLEGQKFDVIYAGNLFHHVDINETLIGLKSHLKNDGILVSWDPLAYNPFINLYRYIATEVRTPDEHPIKMKDIKTFRSHFSKVETKYFWLTTLVIFILMVVKQRRNPNKERFWKSVVDESKEWEGLYKPLEKFDEIILKYIPPLRILCWNIVIFSKK
jgi:2-polyprenyl-3-methyl-5-hydroxy-6-metoxy-1,4-benzoquinol methylase